MSSNPDKAPPSPKDSTNYEDYKETISIWSSYTSIPASKQGMAVYLTLSPADKEAVLQIGKEKICSTVGLANILARLDQIFKKDENSRKIQSARGI